jgi:hypothetical protein
LSSGLSIVAHLAAVGLKIGRLDACRRLQSGDVLESVRALTDAIEDVAGL